MKFLLQTQPPYNLYQKFIWDTKNNENEKVPPKVKVQQTKFFLEN
jgi:hypothetical protein